MRGTILALSIGLAAIAPAMAAGLGVEVVPSIGHQTGMTDIDISPDGRFLATGGGSDTTAKLWDLASGTLLRTFVGQAATIGVLKFAPDSKSLFTGSSGRILRWDLASGEVVGTYGRNSEGDYDDDINAIAFSRDGRTMAEGDHDGNVRLWDITSGRLLQTYHEENKYDFQPLKVLAFSRDGREVIALHGDAIRRWNLGADAVETLWWGRDTGNDLPQPLAIAPDGTAGVGMRVDEKLLRLWPLTPDPNNQTLAHGWTYAADFSPDGRFIIAGGEDGLISFFDRGKAALVKEFGKGAAIRKVKFTPDGRHVVAMGRDNLMAVWDPHTGEKIRDIAGTAAGWVSAAFLADGKRVLTAGRSPVIWDMNTGEVVRRFDALTGNAVISADETRIAAKAADDKAIFVFDVASGTQLTKIIREGYRGGSTDIMTGRKQRWDWGPVSIIGLAITSDGKKVVGETFDEDDHLFRFWDAATGKLLRSSNTKSLIPLRLMLFTPDDKGLLAGHEPPRSDDYRLGLWDGTSGKLLRNFSVTENAQAMALSADRGRILTADWNGVMKLWDMKSAKPLASFDIGAPDSRFVAFSPDGRYGISGAIDNVVKLWDLDNQALVQTFIGHSGHLRAVRFEDGDRILVTIGADGTIRRWDRATGALLLTMVSFTNGEWVRITPEGFFEASPHGAKQLTVVRGLDFYSIEQVYQALYRPDLVAAKLAGDPEGKVREAAARLDLDKVLESGGAPKVAIVSPKEGSTVDADTVAVEADVTDQGGGVGKIEWRVNGVTLGIDARGFDRLAAEAAGAGSTPSAGATAAPAATMGKTIRVTQKLSLDPGENRIEVVAYNAKGLIASDPVAVTVKWEGASAATAPKLYVLAVGVNDYWDSRLKLTYAVPDARAIGEAFRKGGGKLYESVEVTTVLDAEVTAGNLDKVFADLGTKVRPRDVFVFFLAGHGKTEDGRYYFLPQDFRYEDASSVAKGGIDQDRFQAWFAQIAARKSVLLYDTCDSGSLTGGLASRGLEEVAALARMTRAMGRTVLSASTDDAPALEGYRNHGVFTYALLDALGSGDANRDGTIEVTELAGAIDKSVPEISYAAFKLRQVPQMSIVGSDFPLATQTAVLAAALPAETDSLPIAGAPTDVVVAPAVVRATGESGAPEVQTLAPGVLLRVIKTESGWSLVARDGKMLGYVEAGSLARIQ